MTLIRCMFISLWFANEKLQHGIVKYPKDYSQSGKNRRNNDANGHSTEGDISDKMEKEVLLFTYCTIGTKDLAMDMEKTLRLLTKPSFPFFNLVPPLL